MPRNFILLAAALPLLATAQAPCCAFGGSGGATMIADGSLVLPGPGGAPGTRATLATVALGAGVSARGNGFTAVLVGTREGPEASAAGWVIEQNATGQASRPPPPPPPMPMPMPTPRMRARRRRPPRMRTRRRRRAAPPPRMRARRRRRAAPPPRRADPVSSARPFPRADAHLLVRKRGRRPHVRPRLRGVS